MTTSKSEEHSRFDAAMDNLLKADPKLVKAAIEQEKERAEERKSKRTFSNFRSEPLCMARRMR